MFTKKAIIEKFKTHLSDTGSFEVQIAILTGKIKYLSTHFQKFPRDSASRAGFLKMIGRRKTLLNYIKKHSEDNYSSLIKKLDIRK
ncbi:MAG: 30S ribosomal protein S15 [Endomicrobium sp.]|jgi:small subunit ribosomal protein S15|nr:30S ribosomal protein S15 [Endomicrobium sp.]